MPSDFYHGFCDYAQRDNIPTGLSLHWLHLKRGDCRRTTAFKSYEKQICTGLPRPDPLALCILKAQDEGRVSTPACDLLL